MFLNIATIPLLYTSLETVAESLQEQVKQHLYTRNLLRSYALCLSWSPVEVLVSVTIDATKLKYYQIAPVTFGLMVLCWRRIGCFFLVKANDCQTSFSPRKQTPILIELSEKPFSLLSCCSVL